MADASAKWRSFLSISSGHDSRPALHVTTVGATTHFHAMAHRSLGRNRRCEWSILLVPDETSPSGCRRLPLGTASRASPAGAAEPLRYAARTISADRSVVCPSL